MLDEILWNVLRVKIQINFHDFSCWFFTTKNVSEWVIYTIASNGYCLFAIFYIYHELSKDA